MFLKSYASAMKNLLASMAVISWLLLLSACSERKNVVHLSCSPSNDLYVILQKQENMILHLHESPLSAVNNAEPGSAVLVLAGEYPEKRVDIYEEFFTLVREKKLRAFVEYPSFLPGLELEKTIHSKVERAVVNSSLFNSVPDSLQILSINGLNYIPVQVENSHVVAARVAGFDSAVFGLPQRYAPLLFELPDYPVMVSTTNMSQFVSGRYAPQKEWANVWREIISFVLPEHQIDELNWKPVVNPSYGKTEDLPEGYQQKSIIKGINWYKNSKMLIPDGYEEVISNAFNAKINTGFIEWNDTIPEGDGSNGVFECIFSKIDENGNQPIGIVRRGDCTGESAMAFACAGKALGQESNYEIANNLLDFYLSKSPATKNEYEDINHGAYGLTAWGFENYAWYRANYGDDNARLLLGAVVTSAITGNHGWDEILMRMLVAQLRTTGKNGFRGSRIDLPDFEKNGWEYYYNGDITNISPHFEAYLWACMLWAYDKTGDPLFLERTENAIRTTMDNYPDGWRWTNGLAQEKARMILPLSWLVRVCDTPENRKMLLTVVNDLLNLQDECGAIREELGDLKMGKYPPPQSNEAYGTNEASLIGKNGDQVSDLLYTTNFAFLGLHEAYYATNDPKIKAAYDKLAEFLCRIQVSSKGHPELDGGWLRAFDFNRYEHWGSNADHGWGAWAIESGWTQGWIVSILALKEMDTSIWDLTKDSKVNRFYEPLKKQMLGSDK